MYDSARHAQQPLQHLGPGAQSSGAVGVHHGTVVHTDSAAALRARPEVLERLLGVAR